MNWDIFWLVFTIICAGITVFFTVMAIYSSGKLRGMKETQKIYEEYLRDK